METRAILRGVRISAQKGRLVADQVRGLPVERAVDILQFSPKKGASIILKLLQSALANARNNHDADVDSLFVQTIYVDKGSVLKRVNPRAKGRTDRVSKQTAHIHIVVSDKSTEQRK